MSNGSGCRLCRIFSHVHKLAENTRENHFLIRLDQQTNENSVPKKTIDAEEGDDLSLCECFILHTEYLIRMVKLAAQKSSTNQFATVHNDVMQSKKHVHNINTGTNHAQMERRRDVSQLDGCRKSYNIRMARHRDYDVDVFSLFYAIEKSTKIVFVSFALRSL